MAAEGPSSKAVGIELQSNIEANVNDAKEGPVDQDILQAILDKLNSLVDPHLLFREVSGNVRVLAENLESLRKDMETVRKDIVLLKQHRLKQFMWVKENLTKIELDKELLKDELERRTNALTRCLWMTEAAIRDHVTKDGLFRISDMTECERERLDKATPRSISTSTLKPMDLDPPRSLGTTLNTDFMGSDPGITLKEDNPSGSMSNPATPVAQTPTPRPLEDMLPTLWPREDATLPSRITASIMALNSRMHDLETAQAQWKQIYGVQVSGLRAQMQQVQQDNVDMATMFDEITKLKKTYEEEDKGVELRFMHSCADLIAKLHARLENVEKSLEKQSSSGDFRAFARGVTDGMVHLVKAQTTAIELVRRTQQIADERKAKKALKAMKEKEEHELQTAMKFAQIAMGNIRTSVKAENATAASGASSGTSGSSPKK